MMSCRAHLEMKRKIFAGAVLFTVGLSGVRAGQPDPRFAGVWIGTETYTVYGNRDQWAHAPFRELAAIAISQDRKTLGVLRGLGSGRYDVSPKSNGSKLIIHSKANRVGRNNSTFVLSADGDTVTETGFGLLPGTPFAVTCSIRGTFERQGKK